MTVANAFDRSAVCRTHKAAQNTLQVWTNTFFYRSRDNKSLRSVLLFPRWSLHVRWGRRLMLLQGRLQRDTGQGMRCVHGRLFLLRSVRLNHRSDMEDFSSPTNRRTVCMRFLIAGAPELHCVSWSLTALCEIRIIFRQFLGFPSVIYVGLENRLNSVR